jgi:hypothetical protein
MTEPYRIPPVRPANRRSELERLLDRTVLEPTHPELGTSAAPNTSERFASARRRPSDQDD